MAKKLAKNEEKPCSTCVQPITQGVKATSVSKPETRLFNIRSITNRNNLHYFIFDNKIFKLLLLFSAGFQTLAKMYAAEAQMYLANTNEALNLLLEPKKNNFHDMTFTENSDSNNTPNNDLASQSNVAKTIFQVNLAVAFILQVF